MKQGLDALTPARRQTGNPALAHHALVIVCLSLC